MRWPRRIRMHPMDQLCGRLAPQPQIYLLGAPAEEVGLGPNAFRRELAELLRERFPRFCYRIGRRLGTYRELCWDGDLVRPLSFMSLAELRQQSIEQLWSRPGDRHWQLIMAEGEGLQVVALVFDHFLGHGELARHFAQAACDLIRGPEAGRPPRLSSAQAAVFRDLGEGITRRLQAREPWAHYDRRDYDVAALKRLARAVNRPFTDTILTWIGRAIQAVAGRSAHRRELDINVMRMHEEADPGAGGDPLPDPSYGNRDLVLQLWRMSPEGDLRCLEDGAGELQEKLNGYVSFHDRFPFKTALDLLLQPALDASRALELKVGHEKLVVNNLGPARYPFFRPVFFDPLNNVDRFGLVFVDGYGERLQLQFTPPHAFLAHFDWEAFGAQLQAYLEAPESLAEATRSVPT